jgi:hypothetical protein
MKNFRNKIIAKGYELSLVEVSLLQMHKRSGLNDARLIIY